MSEQQRAADAYRAGAAQRDPQAVQKAQTAAGRGAAATAQSKAGGQ